MTLIACGKNICDDPSIRSIQLAPNGVVTMVYPCRAMKMHLWICSMTKKRRAEAEYARDSGKPLWRAP